MTLSLSATQPGPLTRRSSERELDGSKKRATSAGGIERKTQGRHFTLMLELPLFFAFILKYTPGYFIHWLYCASVWWIRCKLRLRAQSVMINFSDRLRMSSSIYEVFQWGVSPPGSPNSQKPINPFFKPGESLIFFFKKEKIQKQLSTNSLVPSSTVFFCVVSLCLVFVF